MGGCLDLEHAERETKRGKRKIYDARGAQYISTSSRITMRMQILILGSRRPVRFTMFAAMKREYRKVKNDTRKELTG